MDKHNVEQETYYETRNNICKCVSRLSSFLCHVKLELAVKESGGLSPILDFEYKILETIEAQQEKETWNRTSNQQLLQVS